MAFARGDIILPYDRVPRNKWLSGLFHPAVVWDETLNENADFTGIILTHRSPNKRFENVLMTANHFENGYEVGFEHTHFVNQTFLKFNDWGPFQLVGKLTAEGIAFIENQLKSELIPMPFLEYYS